MLCARSSVQHTTIDPGSTVVKEYLRRGIERIEAQPKRKAKVLHDDTAQFSANDRAQLVPGRLRITRGPGQLREARPYPRTRFQLPGHGRHSLER